MGEMGEGDQKVKTEKKKKKRVQWGEGLIFNA